MDFVTPLLGRRRSLVAAAFLALALAAGEGSAEVEPAEADLTRLAGRRILFAHQSVGENLLQGIEELAPGALRRVDARTAAELPAGAWADAHVGQNGDPLGKLADLERLVDAPAGAQADLVLFKFCFADFGPETDPAALFARYQETVERLRARHPGATFVHATVPLTTVASGARAWLKHLLGRPAANEEANARRHAYNQLLRAAYAGQEPLFDLARLEAESPDGPTYFEHQGARLPMLAPAFTDDGGHLNRLGRQRAARGLLAALAGAGRR